MILTVIPDREPDLSLGGIAIAALCGAGLAEPFDPAVLTRPATAARGSLQIQCDTSNGPRIKAGLYRAGFATIEDVAGYTAPAIQNPVAVSNGPENQQLLQMADTAADALCGAGLTAEFPDGNSYQGDLTIGTKITVQCAPADVTAVTAALRTVWQFLGSV